MTPDQLKDAVLRNVDPLPAAWSTTPLITNGRLNIGRVIDSVATTPGPGPGPAPTGPGMIVFVSNRDGNREVYKMNPDGSGQTRLTNNSADDYQPAWSPDGRKIVFVSTRDGHPEVYVMTPTGPNRPTFQTAQVWMKVQTGGHWPQLRNPVPAQDPDQVLVQDLALAISKSTAM